MITSSNLRYGIVYLLLVLALVCMNRRATPSLPDHRSLNLIPTSIGGWEMVAQETFDSKVLAVLKPTDYLSRSYRSTSGPPVSLYIGYHDGSPSSGEIHSPRHCLPGSGWVEVSRHTVRIAGGPEVVQALYRRGEHQELIFYWYQVRQQIYTSEVAMKLAKIVTMVREKRRDAAFIRIAVPMDGDALTAAETGQRFTRSIVTILRDFLPS